MKLESAGRRHGFGPFGDRRARAGSRALLGRAARAAQVRSRKLGPRAWLLALLGALALQACVTPARRSLDYGDEPSREPAPDWVDVPVTWSKLDQIETWLASPEALARPEYRVEAELQLAEGRLEFSEADLSRSSVPRESVELRLEDALESFEALLARHDLTPSQRARTEIGRHRALAFLGTETEGGLHVVSRRDWGARPALTSRLTPLHGTWSRITVHHSAETSSPDMAGALEDSARTLRSIQQYHMEQASPLFGDIGYHYMIDSGGRIFEGRDLQWQGAHAGGSANYQNLGICMLGNFEDGRPSDAAMKSLELLIDDLRVRFRIPSNRIQPHRHFHSTVCPGDWVSRWVDAYARTKS